MEKRRTLEPADPYEFGFGPRVMEKVKVCGRCGNTEPADRRGCSVCAEPLPAQTQYQIYRNKHKCCLFCDTVLASYMRYCPHCGKRIE